MSRNLRRQMGMWLAVPVGAMGIWQGVWGNHATFIMIFPMQLIGIAAQGALLWSIRRKPRHRD